MKIVVLDGYALNPGDLNWDGFNQLGELVVYDRTPYDKTVERCTGAEVLLTNKAPVRKEDMENLPGLKYIGVLATGFNIIDVETARKKNITVSNIPVYGTASVMQLTFALLLELCHHVQRHSDSVMSGKWSQSPDFSFRDFPLIELAGKTMGIIGFGHIGEQVADVAAAFGMHILGSKRHPTDQTHRKNFSWATVTELLEKSDVVSIHCPLSPQTEGLINRESLQRMKKSAWLINTSRGPIIVEKDLADALNQGTIAGAALDVLSTEPPPADNPLFKAKNCIITPHIAWATKEARTRLMDMAVSNLKAFKEGRPVHVVNR
jgi:glycerate dehydrogenase